MVVTMVTGVGKPILVIPWVVMQELDSLKVGVSTDDITLHYLYG